jgi:hypothetical protein
LSPGAFLTRAVEKVATGPFGNFCPSAADVGSGEGDDRIFESYGRLTSPSQAPDFPLLFRNPAFLRMLRDNDGKREEAVFG